MSQVRDDPSDDIRSLARAVNEHLTDGLVRRLHIETPVESEILFNVEKNRSVFVTGNPGDGKTHLIRTLRGDFPDRTIVVTDANQIESEELISTFQRAIAKRIPLVVAVNEGILLQACGSVRDRHPWAAEIINAILNPYRYSSPTQLGNSEGDIVILDLTRRNNLAGAIVTDAIRAVANLALSGSDQSLISNAERISRDDVVARICSLLDAVARGGFHATMRDLLGFVAHLICGGEDRIDEIAPQPYYVNAFEDGEGPLFTVVRRFDPLRVPAPFLDDNLFEDDDRPGDWLVEAPEESASERDLNMFARRKRRAFFEHRDGAALVRGSNDGIEAKLNQLRNVGRSPERVAVALLNRFFDASSSHESGDLVIWTAHRYDARPVRYLASSTTIPASELEIRVPVLPGRLRIAFPSHYGDHVVLVQRDMETQDGLVIDARLLGQLLDGDRLSGLGVRHPEAYVKVTSFYDRLARRGKTGSAVVRILRSDTMQHVDIGVDVERRAYFLPGA